jgi:hypothetical protein
VCKPNLSWDGSLFSSKTWSHARQTQQHEMLRGRQGWAWLGIRSRQAQIGRHKRQTKKLPLCEHPTIRDITTIAVRRAPRLIGIYGVLVHTCPLEQVELHPSITRSSRPNIVPMMPAGVGPAGTNDDQDAYSFLRPRNNVDLVLWPCCLKMLDSHSLLLHTHHIRCLP